MSLCTLTEICIFTFLQCSIATYTYIVISVELFNSRVKNIVVELITFSPELVDKEKLGGNYSREILSKLILAKHKLRIYSLFKMTYFASTDKYAYPLA